MVRRSCHNGSLGFRRRKIHVHCTIQKCPLCGVPPFEFCNNARFCAASARDRPLTQGIKCILCLENEHRVMDRTIVHVRFGYIHILQRIPWLTLIRPHYPPCTCGRQNWCSSTHAIPIQQLSRPSSQTSNSTRIIPPSWSNGFLTFGKYYQHHTQTSQAGVCVCTDKPVTS